MHLRGEEMHYVSICVQSTIGCESLDDDGYYHLLFKLEVFLGGVENKGRIPFINEVYLALVNDKYR